MRRINYFRMIFIGVVAVLIATGCTAKTEPFPTGTYLCKAKLDNAFMEDGTFIISGGGSVVAEGNYTVDGDEITIIDNTCTGEGIYTWSFKDGKLMFEVIDDDCSIRRDTLTSGLTPKQ